jgi:hypothetical protein
MYVPCASEGGANSAYDRVSTLLGYSYPHAHSVWRYRKPSGQGGIIPSICVHLKCTHAMHTFYCILQRGYTALMYAVQSFSGGMDLVKDLLDAGASPWARNKVGSSYSHVECKPETDSHGSRMVKALWTWPVRRDCAACSSSSQPHR